MTQYEFVVSVEVQSETCANSMEALVEAGRYLAYADATDTFGHPGQSQVKEVFTELEDGGWIVTIKFTTPMFREDTLERFCDELETLSRVDGFTFSEV